MQVTISNVVFFVREALEQEECKRSYTGFNIFPFGSCMDASIILGQLLIKYCNCAFELIAANKEQPFKSHSWLENRDFIIDITADQFGEGWASFIIEKPQTGYPTDDYFETIRRPVGNEDYTPIIAAYRYVDKFIQDKLKA